MPLACWLLPGTILKGRYVIGRVLREEPCELVYLGWDTLRKQKVELHEYYPKEYLQRDITASEDTVCLPGKEAVFESGLQQFFERVRLYYQCMSRVDEDVNTEFFLRNGTGYYTKAYSPEIKK